MLLPLAPEDGDCGAIFWLGPELLSVAAPNFAEGVVESVNNCADVGDAAKNAAMAPAMRIFLIGPSFDCATRSQHECFC